LTQDTDTKTIGEKVTRVEVISQNGREYVNMSCHSVVVSEQDEGRTIKIFLQKDDY
jgi:hypothetical protein